MARRLPLANNTTRRGPASTVDCRRRVSSSSQPRVRRPPYERAAVERLKREGGFSGSASRPPDVRGRCSSRHYGLWILVSGGGAKGRERKRKRERGEEQGQRGRKRERSRSATRRPLRVRQRPRLATRVHPRARSFSAMWRSTSLRRRVASRRSRCARRHHRRRRRPTCDGFLLIRSLGSRAQRAPLRRLGPARISPSRERATPLRGAARHGAALTRRGIIRRRQSRSCTVIVDYGIHCEGENGERLLGRYDCSNVTYSCVQGIVGADGRR